MRPLRKDGGAAQGSSRGAGAGLAGRRQGARTSRRGDHNRRRDQAGAAMSFRTLDDLPEDLAGKKVLVRVDLNVPMEGASVTDDTRLRAMLPTVLELSDRGAIVLLLSHFGRPKGQSTRDMSTAQLVLPLRRLTGRSVRFV